MKKKITTVFILASLQIGNVSLAQENVNIEFIEWVEDGKLDEVKKYLTMGADVNFIDEEGVGAGEYAIWNIEKDNGSMLNYLIDSGLKVDYRSPDGRGLLHIAAAYNGSVVFKKLIDKGIGINDLTENGESAVFIAAEFKDFEGVKALVALGANVQLQNQEGETILISYDLEKEELWNDLMSFKLSTEQLNNLLIKATYNLETLDKVKELIDKGADVNAKNEDAIPVLHLASKLDDPAILIFLIEKGANVNILDDQGYNALWETKTLENMSILLDKGTDPNQVVDEELLMAQFIYWASIDEVKLLASRGANVNLKTDGESLITFTKELLNLEHRPGAKFTKADAQAKADEEYKSKINEIIKFLQSKGSK